MERRKQRQDFQLIVLAIALLLSAGQGRPPGSEKAVEAFRKAFPTATLEGIYSPGPMDPAAGIRDVRLYWVLRYRLDGKQHEALVTPDGLLIRTQETVPTGGLPEPVARGIRQLTSVATVRRVQSQETLATLKYAASPSPRVYYGAEVEKDGKTSKVNVRPDGRAEMPMEGIASDLLLQEGPPYIIAPSEKKPPVEIPIPEGAAKAVGALKARYPGCVLTDFRTTIYDDKTGHVETAYFELEIVIVGKARTVPVTPDGILVYLTEPVDPAAVPASVVSAILARVPGGTISRIVRQDVLAVPSFVPLEKPRFAYAVEIESQYTRRRQVIPFDAEGRQLDVFLRGR
jgi:hypothetical protein